METCPCLYQEMPGTILKADLQTFSLGAAISFL